MRPLRSILAALLLIASPAFGQSGTTPTGGFNTGGGYTPTRMERTPDAAVGVNVEEQPNKRLPLEATFRDSDGNPVQLGKYFTGQRPVVLQLGYFSCPKLCGMIASGTLDSLRQLDLDLGKDFDLVYLSIDPREGPEKAAAFKHNYIASYVADGGAKSRDKAAAEAGWHFLTGNEGQIKNVARAVGFNYKWVESSQEYSHPAVLILITPEGVVSRYLYGVKFDPKVMRLSVVDASTGKVGSIMDAIIMLCFHYDESTGKYTLAAVRVMKIGGAVSVLLLASAVGAFAWVGHRRRHPRPPHNPNQPRGLRAVLTRPPPT